MNKDIEDRLQRDLERTLFGGAASNITPTFESTLDLRKALPEWEKMLRNARRSQVVFIVDRAHQGPPITHETPNDGTRIELSWPAADAVHQQWPLKLFKVLSVDAAEFVPINSGFGEWAPKHLPQPPYEVPKEENFEDWVSGKSVE